MYSINDIPITPIVIKTNNITPFYSLMQEGVYCKTTTRLSIMDFLNNYGVTKEYAANTIKTAFLNSKPVDDLESVYIHDGDCLSLSGAMPGLVGAVMRIKSPFQSFRQTISYGSNDEIKNEHTTKEGLIYLKLFNTILSGTAVAFLERGVIVDVGRLLSVLKSNTKFLRGSIIRYQSKKLTAGQFVNMLSKPENSLIEVKLEYLH